MVYRGKPSAACGECRTRRTRCDQAVPACGQCIKAKRTCTGYRNTIDLMFHDESKQVARKNKKRFSDSAKTQAVGDGSSELAVAAVSVKLTDFILYQPLNDLGLNYFMSTYVGDDPAVSQFHYLPKLYAKTGYANLSLQQIIVATGLAGYAKTARRQDVSDTATKYYVAAIQGINAALSDPKTAVQDTTLTSIIMAAMYEVITVPRLSNMQNCSKHLEGAIVVALMSLAQKKATDVTEKLLATLVDVVIINSWISHTPLPRRLTELKQRVGKRLYPDSLHGNFLDLVMQVLQFKEALHTKTYKTPVAIIKQALAIENNLETFAQNMPTHAHYQEFKIPLKSAGQLAYAGYYHVYPQRFSAHLWNNVRTSRLRLHQVVLRQCRTLVSSSLSQQFDSMDTQQAKSTVNIVNLAVEIAATVPQLAGYLDQLAFPEPSELDSSPDFSEAPIDSQLLELTVRAKNTGTMEYSSHSGDGPNSFRRSTQNKPSAMSVFYSDCNDEELHAETQLKPRTELNSWNSAQPASVYHMLFQLYTLRTVSLLPDSLRVWVQGRIKWMENITDVEDLKRLREMIAQRPSDGFPV